MTLNTDIMEYCHYSKTEARALNMNPISAIKKDIKMSSPRVLNLAVI